MLRLSILLFMSGCFMSPEQVIDVIKREQELCLKAGGKFYGKQEHQTSVPETACIFESGGN